MFISAYIRRSSWPIHGLLVLLTLLVYANSFPGAFILDDIHIAQNNPLFHDPDLVTLFRADYWYGYQHSGVYRPLTILSLLLNRLLFGEGPLGFHSVNVLMHAGVVVLMWAVLRAWNFPERAALLAAMLFAIHPLHVEVVNVVVGRSELLVATFLLAGFLAARRSGVVATLVLCCCFLLALLAKEHAITFLALLPLCDAYEAGSVAVWRRRLPLYALLLAITVAWLCWRTYGIVDPLPLARLTEAAAPLAFVDVTTRVLTALQLQWVYLFKLVSGTGLQAVYSNADLPDFIRTPFSVRGGAICVVTLLAAAALWRGWRVHSRLALCGLLYLVAFAPASNVFIPIGIVMAERVTYFPSLWFCAGAGLVGAALLEGRRWRVLAWVGIVAAGVWFAGMTVLRNPEFGSELRLWSAEVDNNPADYLAWQSLAESYANVDLLPEADAAYLRMLALAPDYPGGLRSRTVFLMRTRRYAEALQAASKAYALSLALNDPQDIAFDGLDMAESYVGLANYQEALRYLETPAMLPAKSHTLFFELRGKALAGLGRDAEAVQAFERVAEDFVGSDLRYHHGQSLFRLGQLTDARRQLERAVGINSDGPSWNLLGVVCAQLGDVPAAQAAFENALKIEPDNRFYLENLEKTRQGGR